MRFGRSAMAVGLVALVVGCGDRQGHPPADRAFEQARAEQTDEPVATVEDSTLGVGTFRRVWEKQPELSRADVVDEVIEREVAVEHGLDEGEIDWSAVGLARKKAMVRRLLRETVEDAVEPDDLDEQAIRAEMKRLRAEVGRPAGLRASHLVVAVPGEIRERKKKDQPLSDAQQKLYEQARRRAEGLGDSLPADAHLEDLYDAQSRAREKSSDGLEIVVNAHLRFARPGQPDSLGGGPDAWRQVVDTFAEAADRLARDDKLGELSEPVETHFGVHLIVVEERIPAKVPDDEALREVAVSRLLRKKRNERLNELYKKWSAEARTTVFPERLETDE